MKKFFKEKTLLLIANLIVLNFLWIIFSLPLITIGAANSALYSHIEKIEKSLYRIKLNDFWESFKENFYISSKIWIIFLMVFVQNLFGIIILESHTKISPVFIFPLIISILLLGVISQYIFILIVRGENKLKKLFFKSLVLGIIKFHYTLLFLTFYILNIIIFIFYPLVFLIIWPFYILIGFSLFAFLKYKTIKV